MTILDIESTCPFKPTSPAAALHGLIREALRRGAKDLHIEVTPDQMIFGHNGTLPTVEGVLQPTGSPQDLQRSADELRSLLHAPWCHHLQITTAQWTLQAGTGNGKHFEVTAGEPGVDGIWFELHGTDLQVTLEDVVRSAGFTDVDVHFNQQRLPSPTQGRLVLEHPPLKLHLYDMEPEPAAGDGRNLSRHWNAVHHQGDTYMPFTELWADSLQVLAEVGRPDLKDLLLRMHLVIEPSHGHLFLGEERLILNEKALLPLMQQALRAFPEELGRLVKPLRETLTDGTDHLHVTRFIQQHHLPESWVEAELRHHGWKSCPHLLANAGLPVVQQRWHQGAVTTRNMEQVIWHNLLRTLGEDLPPCAEAWPEEQETLQVQKYPIELAPGQLKLHHPERVRAWMAQQDTRGHLLMNVAGLLVRNDDSFFTHPALTQANLLLVALLGASS